MSGRDTPTWRRYLRFWGSNPREDIADEITFHLEMKVQDLVRRGMSEEEARARAGRAFGDAGAIRKELAVMSERHGERVRKARLLEELRFDGVVALRALRRRPLHTFAIIAILALGAGASTAIFSVVRGILLRPLPYPDPNELMVVWERNVQRNRNDNVVSVPNFEAWRERSRSFASLAALVPEHVTLRSDVAERVSGGQVSPSWFDVVRWQPALGRAFTEEDARAGARVVVLSHGFWQRRFGGERNIVGSSVTFDDQAYTVIGVMPAAFAPPQFGWLSEQEFWIPFSPSEDNRQWGRYLLVLGRLRPGITPAQASAEIVQLGAQMAAETEANRGWAAETRTLYQQLTGPIRPAVTVVFAAALLLLLIGIVNVANLLVARAHERRGEFGLRAALGAARGRLVRQLLAENLVLAALTAPVAVVLAIWGLHALIPLFPPGLPRSEGVRIDGVVLAFCLALTLGSLLLVGAFPALLATRARLEQWLRRAGTRVSRVERSQLVVVGEVALAAVLLVSAGLLVRSFSNLRAVSLGFDAEQVTIFRIALQSSNYPTGAQRNAFHDRLLDRLRALPGVSAVGATSMRPLGGAGPATTVVAPDLPAMDVPPVADVRGADGEYFRALHVPLVAGRLFDTRDQPDAQRVVLISELLARTLWPNESAVGKRLNVGINGGLETVVIGVVGDVRLAGPIAEPRGTVYHARWQFALDIIDVAVRSDLPPEKLTEAARHAIAEVDRNLPLYHVEVLNDAVAEATSQQRLSTILLGAFAAFALLLVGGGIYAVLALEVARRRRDLGIRMALGASPGQIRSLLLGGALRHAVLGLLLGGLALLAAARYLQSLLYDLDARDPLTFGGSALVLLSIALLAAWLPARRATRLDPATVIRLE